ncbi:MAG: rod shape-determining protein MreC [Actinomycetota bacterium]|nr:rod shape-determining protein MreC [Actinomycetota bacterium]
MFSSLSRRRVIALVVLTGLLFITIDRNGNPVFDRARGAVATVLRPIDTATEALTLPIERAWFGISNYDDLERENEALRDQIEQLRGNDVEAQSAIIEYRQLLNVLQLTSKFDYPTLAAQVVGESPSNFQNTVEINVGSNRGVQKGMPVTDGAGLVGKITEVYPERSIVRLITDPDYAVTAQVLSVDEPVTATTTTTSDDPDGTGSSSSSTSTTSTTTTTGVPTTDPVSGQPISNTTTAPSSTTTTLLEVVRETGTLEGQGGGKPLLLRFTDSTSSVTSVKVGAIVDTAGGNNSLAPQGIPIGTITRIVDQTGDSSRVVEVTPNANLRRLYFVTVVLFVSNADAVGR